MTMSEFKAWLEGYEESFIEDAPSREQWAKIKSKLDEVKASPPATLPQVLWPLREREPERRWSVPTNDGGWTVI